MARAVIIHFSLCSMAHRTIPFPRTCANVHAQCRCKRRTRSGHAELFRAKQGCCTGCPINTHNKHNRTSYCYYRHRVADLVRKQDLQAEHIATGIPATKVQNDGD